MKQKELHCLVIRGHTGRYPALVQALSRFSNNIKINLIDNDAVTVKKALLNKKLGLIFLFQESGLAMNVLADILQKNGSESILVSLDDSKPQSALSVKTGYTGVQVCNLHYRPSGAIVNLALKFLLQYAFLKTEFRNCKSLLRVSEQRCHWLVNSSSEAVAYIVNDLHLYANHAYIDLLSDSLHSLKITAVSDLICEDEREVFFDFVRQYETRSVKASALIVTLHPQKGEDFRASVRLIPTVFSGTRCYQLWIRKLGVKRLSIGCSKGKSAFDASPSIVVNTIDDKSQSPWLDNPVSKEATRDNQSLAIKTESKTKTPLSNKPSIYRKLLKQIILSNEISLELSKLDMFTPVDATSRQYMVDLNVLEHEYATVSSILDKKYHTVFWDQVMLILLFQRLKQTGSKGMRLLIPLAKESMQDDWFKSWLGSSLSRFEGDVSSCVFLFPLSIDLLTKDLGFKKLHQELIRHHCAIGIDSFGINQQTKLVLEVVAPEFIRFSKKWVLSNIKNNKEALKLVNTIKILKKKKIKVIAPYQSGEKMMQLFDMSGASFRQEQIVS